MSNPGPLEPNPLTSDAIERGQSTSINPYAIGQTDDAAALETQWPWLEHAESKKVRQVALDAKRAPLSLIGAIALGMLGPMTFVGFFWGQRRLQRRLLRDHPELAAPDPNAPELAKHFAKAEATMTGWLRFYAALLVLEVVYLSVTALSF